MKKSLMSNIRNFVDSNVRQRIDRVAHNNNEFFSDELLLVERQYEDLRYICVEAEKRISTLLQSIHSSSVGSYTQNVQAGINNLSQLASSNSTNTITSKQNESLTSNNLQINSGPYTASKSSAFKAITPTSGRFSPRHDTPNSNCEPYDSIRMTFANEVSNGIQQKYKKLPIVGFLKFLLKSSNKLKSGSPLAITLSHCSHLQSQLTELYLSFEQRIETQCLRPLRQILENDIPNVSKLRKSFIKWHNDLESAHAKYNTMCHKQQQSQSSHSTSNSYAIVSTNPSNSQTSSINKLDQLKKELDEALSRFEQAKDIYETELYAFICRETELADLIARFYSYHFDYHQQVSKTIQSSLPTLSSSLTESNRKAVFGTPLEEHLRCSGRSISPVIELCIHLLYANGLDEEGLFRIPGSSVKVKKMKHAINAWFITLATTSNQDDERSHNQGGGQSSVLAIYDLFKTIVVKKEHLPSHQQSSPEVTPINLSITMALNRPDQPSNQNNSLANGRSIEEDNQFDTAIDVHTVAGLLKLYLRELPEPLLTYANYNRWIEAVRKPLTNDDRVEVLSKIIQQLPQCNRDNLKHLIRFLNLLNSHKESNKMSASNLAIAIAPSLIWCRPQVDECHLSTDAEHQGVAGTKNNNLDNSAQAFDMQMSNFGMSASLHALILESLINHADKLFPGQVDFKLSEFKGLIGASLAVKDAKIDQCHLNRLKAKSTSPTCLSTTSSSSLSSGSSLTTSAGMSQQTTIITDTMNSHSRKGGSMDGLLGQNVALSAALQQKYPPPPVPPMPVNRNYNLTSQQQMPVSSGHRSKPPAPPVPPPVDCSRSLRARPCSIAVSADEQISRKINPTISPEPHQPVQPKSLRGTGNISTSPEISNTLPNSACPYTTRPSVPPPERPHKAYPRQPIQGDDVIDESSINSSQIFNDIQKTGDSRPRSADSKDCVDVTL